MNLASLLAALIQAMPAGAGPSFDCARATQAVERTICSDAALARLDAEVATQYVTVLARLSPAARTALRRDQRRYLAARNEWFENRDRWAGFPDLAERMRERIAFLASLETWRTGWAGRWSNLAGELEIRAARAGELEVEITTVQPANARWICQAGFRAHASGNLLEGAPAEDTAWTLRAERGDGMLVVSETPSSGEAGGPGYCGSNGSLAGVYFPIQAR